MHDNLNEVKKNFVQVKCISERTGKVQRHYMRTENSPILIQEYYKFRTKTGTIVPPWLNLFQFY